jgi:PHD/YefM family antitoxin component YafN of YafNO toxin-antitoxin module
MQTITFDVASRELKDVIQKVIRDKEETVISLNEGAVVILEESEWVHLKETLRLISDKTSLTALLASHSMRDMGQKPEGIDPDEAFSDI